MPRPSTTAARGADSSRLSKTLIGLDELRRAAIAKSQAAQERRNAASKEIGKAMAAKDSALAEALKAEVADLKAALPALEAEERAAIEALDKALVRNPEHAAAGCAFRQGRERQSGTAQSRRRRRNFAFQPKEHFDIGEGSG